MENLREIFNELVNLRRECNLPQAEDSVLFDCGVRIFNSQNINQQPKEIKSEPATEKQRNLLKKLNYKKDVSVLTKQDANREISKLLEKK